MFPALKPGQDILSFNWAYKPNIGDIVVIKVNEKEMVKRVQNVYDREVFVIGDNRTQSTDSRQFGSVNMNQIIGRMIYQSNEP